jgi:hypothetical protein
LIISIILVLFILQIDDDSDVTQDMSAVRLASKPSSHDLLPVERDETSPSAPSAKVETVKTERMSKPILV